MSFLPTAIGTQLSEKDVSAAVSAIGAARDTPQPLQVPHNGFPTIPLLGPLTDNQQKAVKVAQAKYENMEWSEVLKDLTVIKKRRFEKPKQVESRLLFCRMMLATPSDAASLYHDVVKYLPLDVLNGDLYVGLALLKLYESPNPHTIDCATLLLLAATCCSYHPGCMRMAREKQQIYLYVASHIVRKLLTNIRTPEDVQWFKDNYPEIKASSNAVDDAVREFHSAPAVEQFRLLCTWTRTPSLAPFVTGTRQIDVTKLENASMLLCMPDSVFGKIMEYSSKRSMLNIAETSFLGYQRVEFSTAWLHHASITFGVTIKDVIDSKLRNDEWKWFMQQLRILQSLAHTNMWNITTSAVLKSKPTNYFVRSSRACTDPLMEAFTHFLSGGLLSGMPSYVMQWLVSNSNFHLTLARLSLTAPHELSTLLLDSLHFLLSSAAADASKWTQDLLDAGFQHSLQTRAGKLQAPSQLLAHLKLHHIQRSSSIDRILTKTLSLLAADAPEEHEMILSHLPGVYHVTGYRIRDWETTAVTPFFASFQVDRRSLSLSVGTDGLNDEIDEQRLKLPEDLSEDSVVVKMTGHGRYVDRHGEISLVELKIAFVRDENDLKMHATIGGKARMSLSGSATQPEFAGEITYWDDDPTDSYLAIGGAFLLWKSALPDTESNWNDVHMPDIEALHKLRTSGGYEYERTENVASRETPEHVHPIHQSSLQEAQNSVMQQKFRLTGVATMTYHPVNIFFMKGFAEAFKKLKPVHSCSNAVPRRPYDTADMQHIRGRLRFALMANTPPFYADAAHALSRVSDVASDLLVLCKAMRRLFSSLNEDAKRTREYEKMLSKRFIAALDLLGLNPSSDALQTLLNDLGKATRRLKRHIDRGQPSKMPEDLTTSLEMVARAMLPFCERQIQQRLGKPVESSKASELVLTFLEEHTPKPKTKVYGVSKAVANESSPLCKAIVAEYERLDSQNDLTKVLRKWSYIFGTARPGIDVYSENIIPLLIASLIKALLPDSNPTQTENERSKVPAQADDTKPRSLRA